MNVRQPLNTRRRVAAAAALLCGAASGAALLYANAREQRQRRRASRAARVRCALQQLDAALDRYALALREKAAAARPAR